MFEDLTAFTNLEHIGRVRMLLDVVFLINLNAEIDEIRNGEFILEDSLAPFPLLCYPIWNVQSVANVFSEGRLPTIMKRCERTYSGTVSFHRNSNSHQKNP